MSFYWFDRNFLFISNLCPMVQGFLSNKWISSSFLPYFYQWIPWPCLHGLLIFYKYMFTKYIDIRAFYFLWEWWRVKQEFLELLYVVICISNWHVGSTVTDKSGVIHQKNAKFVRVRSTRINLVLLVNDSWFICDCNFTINVPING